MPKTLKYMGFRDSIINRSMTFVFKEGDPMNDVIEAKEGIFEYTSPQKISTEQWANEHLDCNAIIDDLGSYIIVYAFTRDPNYNSALTKYKQEKKYTKQYILRGISSDGLNSLF